MRRRPDEDRTLALTYREQCLSGWGRYAPSSAAVARPERQHEIAEALRPPRQETGGVIARGGGLAYGDAAANAGGRVVAMNRLNRFLDFDVALGKIRCEAGVTVGEILDVSIRQGWFLAVTPGTHRATVGGCLACDVHGKNHHVVGSFSQHVETATLFTGNGETVTCGPGANADLFWATSGGMGLTGIIVEMTLRLMRIETASIVARNIVAADLEATLRVIEHNADATYSVAWLDGASRGRHLGRGIVMLGEHARQSELPADRRNAPLSAKARTARSLPFGLPAAVLGRSPAVRVFNDAVYRRYRAGGARPSLVDASRYFYPLDTFDNWNRLFGRKGFFEYQVLLPLQQALPAMTTMLDMLTRAGAASVFTSVKRLGAGSAGHLSFPAPGYAFSFDLPAAGDGILALLDRCDEVTLAAGGRVYLAKDARTRADTFGAMYPRLGEWRAIARRYDRDGVLSSSMSRRLGLDQPA